MVLSELNKQILAIFTAYASTFAIHNSAHLGDDVTTTSCQCQSSSMRAQAMGLAVPSNNILNKTPLWWFRSLFVANSGHGDIFHSVSELAATSRSGIYLNEHATPSMEHFSVSREGNKGGFALNAYIYDFYMHGQVSTLAAANGIRRGDIWYLLDDFILSLTTVCAAIEPLLMRASKEAEADIEGEILDVESEF